MIKGLEPWVQDDDNDNLGWPENLADVFNGIPAVSPHLIEGVLRKGHKMLIAGPSKVGKSYMCG